MPLKRSVKDKGSDGMNLSLTSNTIKSSILCIGHLGKKVGESLFPERIKIMMECLRTILRNDSILQDHQ